MSLISVIKTVFSASLLQSSLSHDPSEIIQIYLTFLFKFDLLKKLKKVYNYYYR